MFSSCLSLISGNSMAFFQQGFVEKYLKLWYSWRCVVSSLIAIDTWWGINSTPLNIILCVNDWEESKSHSSLVLPEGTSFPHHVAKPFCVQNFSKISFSCCTQPHSFCRVHRHMASDRCKYGPSSLGVPPAWFLWEVFAVWPALESFFFHYCHVFEVHVLLSTAGLKLLFVWYSALVFLTSQWVQDPTVLPWIMEGSWKPD